MAAQRRPDLVTQDAGDFVRDLLATPQEQGVTRVLYHSVMWQYLPGATRDAIIAMMAAAGARGHRGAPAGLGAAGNQPANLRA